MIDSKLFSSPDDKLENALLLLATGLPLSEVLAEAGDDAAWLGPLLQMAAEIGDLGQAVLVPPAEPSLQRMLDYGQELAGSRSAAVSAAEGWQAGLARLFGGLFPRLATLLLAVVLVGGAATVLTQQSLPGQPLYSLKRASETLRLNFTPDPQDRARLRNDFNQRRQEETHLLLQQNRVAPVAFEGQVESVTLTSLRVAGWAAQLTPQTEIRGNLAAGARIRLEALTQPPDQLIVLSVTVLEPAPPAPTATTTPTPIPQATATPGVSQATDTLILPTATHTPVLSRATDVLTLPTATATTPVTPVLSPSAVSPTLDSAGERDEAAPTPTPQLDEGNTNDNTNEDRGDDDVGNEAEDNTNDSDGNDGGDNSGSSGDDRSGDDNSGSDDSGGGDDHSGSNDDNSGSDDKDDRDDKDDD